MFVLCFDLHGRGRTAVARSRAHGGAPDRVPELLEALAPAGLRRPAERAVGDQAVAVAERAEEALALLRIGCELGDWAMGLGIGAAEEPAARAEASAAHAGAAPGPADSLGATAPSRGVLTSVREVRGPALHAALDALDSARRSAGVPLSVRAADPRHEETARDAEAVLRLVGRLIGERGPGQRRAVAAARERPGARQSELAEQLGVRQQTVSRALRTAGWHEETAARPLAERLLAMIDLTSGRAAGR
ncbi:hypothetical protein [Brachybacterium phenoliresistens]|uniref:MarR family transcriptional regulator n=1 Tax=Brachybacterium phenoliresistens TaxID=396014 RepID=Z9JYH6_9MICO|nr:hypothetical protein [Brachybacterium phenoliresistens]EWS82852.1 MarR family transcriptional regulator [Brachybacterium phenoliresistens]